MCKIQCFLLVLLTYVVTVNAAGMSIKQVEAAVKLVRNVCQPKTKATQEDIDKMHRGDWNIDHTAMCYMYCAFNKYKLMGSDNKFDLAAGKAQLKLLPDVYRDAADRCMHECKDAAAPTEDSCAAAYDLSKCFYFCSPETYFLP